MQLEELQIKTLPPDNSGKINSNYNWNTVLKQLLHMAMLLSRPQGQISNYLQR